MKLSTNELSTLLSWFDSICKHNDMYLIDPKNYELRDKLKKELLGY